MATHKQHFLTCDDCYQLYTDDNGVTIKGETPDCVRAEAEDDGWTCRQGVNESTDYCKCCSLENA